MPVKSWPGEQAALPDVIALSSDKWPQRGPAQIAARLCVMAPHTHPARTRSVLQPSIPAGTCCPAAIHTSGARLSQRSFGLFCFSLALLHKVTVVIVLPCIQHLSAALKVPVLHTHELSIATQQ